MNKKYILILCILGGLLGVSLLVGVSYAYYMVSVSQTNKNIVRSSCLNLSISNEENVIKLEKQIPIMNEEGKKLTPYTFTINNACSSMMAYSLNLEELEGSTLASKYIMTMVNDKSYVNMASLSSTDNYYANSVESRVLVTGSLGANASVDYSLRLWMDEDTPLTSEAMNKSFRSKVVVVATPTNTVDFDYTGTEQVFTAPSDGKYKIELWGAQGGSDYSGVKASLGGYVSGNILLKAQEKLYVYVGESPRYGSMSCYESNPNTAFNSSHFGTCAVGGGATDVRTAIGSDWDDFNSLKSRIMVAGGGGGGIYIGNGGASGGLIGYPGIGFNSTVSYSIGAGGTQNSSSFGKSLEATTMGGGGYYAGNFGSGANAGGGSSFISGHDGCDAIKEESTENNIIHTGQSVHYSGMHFTDTVMIDGEGYKWTTEKGEYTGMPSHDGAGTMKGNAGNGYARITYIGNDK
ncbi:putative uncharacterized protein [Coprobacillus sp. CAG:605]|nr:putative uncharacterized protein [Coprobacillus sp. CAG:605]